MKSLRILAGETRALLDSIHGGGFRQKVQHTRSILEPHGDRCSTTGACHGTHDASCWTQSIVDARVPAASFRCDTPSVGGILHIPIFEMAIILNADPTTFEVMALLQT